MATRAFIQNLINTNLANNSDILPSEHREVENTLLTELFPPSVKVEWNGTAPVDPVTDIVCNTGLTTAAKCTFKFYFEKVGNRVFVSGIVRSLNTSAVIGFFDLVYFSTTLYRPLANSLQRTSVNNNDTTLSNAVILASSAVGFLNAAIKLRGSLPADPNSSIIYTFSFDYKVAN